MKLYLAPQLPCNLSILENRKEKYTFIRHGTRKNRTFVKRINSTPHYHYVIVPTL